MRTWLLLLAALTLPACDDDPEPAEEPRDDAGADAGPPATTFSADRFLRDAEGRALVLRGVNIAHTAKRAPDGIPWVDAAAVARLRKEFGFNVIRLTVFWNHVEPERGQYAASYLAALRDILDWAEASEQLVVLDMHQDLFGFVSQDEGEGDGVPVWARKADCPPFEDKEQWTDNYPTEAMQCQFAQFWNNERGVLDDFTAMWKHVASELGAHPAVVGVDLFNEPWVGAAGAQRTLGPFYEKLIPAVREAVPGIVVFFEPGTLSGGGITDQSLRTPDFDNLVYAPHFYPYDVYLLRPGAAYTRTGTIETINDRQRDDVGGAIQRWIGEFGISAGVGNASQYYLDLLDAWRGEFVGFALWSYDKSDDYPYVMLNGDGDPHAHTEALFEPYVERIPGMPRTTAIDRATGTLTLVADAVAGQLVISCPRRFCMAKHDVSVQRGPSGAAEAVAGDYDAELGILRVALEAGADTTVTLSYAP